jgi:hypothetical protein
LLLGKKAVLSELLQESENLMPIFVPCFAHRANLAWKWAARLSPELDTIFRNIISISGVLSRPLIRERLQAVCPSFVKVRWFSFRGIVKFLVKHKEELFTIEFDDYREIILQSE